MKTTTLVSLNKTTAFQKQMYPMSLFYHLPIINTQNMLFQKLLGKREASVILLFLDSRVRQEASLLSTTF